MPRKERKKRKGWGFLASPRFLFCPLCDFCVFLIGFVAGYFWQAVDKTNEIYAFSVSPLTGELTKLCLQSAHGRSTCYLTLDVSQRNLLFVNYWDSTIGCMELTPTGRLTDQVNMLPSGRKLVASVRSDHLRDRQSEPHAHAIVLDPFTQRVAFVPDLGEDCVRQYVFDSSKGLLEPAGIVSIVNDGPSGPRYVDFHPVHTLVLVVNELASTVSVFEFLVHVAKQLQPGDTTPTLKLLQTVSTIPTAFPRQLNTCGRITVDPSGNFVVVSNRGHNRYFSSPGSQP